MSQVVTFNGVNYTLASAGDPPGWGAAQATYLAAVAAGAAAVNVVNTFTAAQTFNAPVNLLPTTAPTSNATAQLYQDVATGQLSVVMPGAGSPTQITQAGGNGVFRLNNLAADPSSPLSGQIYYNTTFNAIRVYAAGAWYTLSLP